MKLKAKKRAAEKQQQSDAVTDPASSSNAPAGPAHTPTASDIHADPSIAISAVKSRSAPLLASPLDIPAIHRGMTEEWSELARLAARNAKFTTETLPSAKTALIRTQTAMTGLAAHHARLADALARLEGDVARSASLVAAARVSNQVIDAQIGRMEQPDFVGDGALHADIRERWQAEAPRRMVQCKALDELEKDLDARWARLERDVKGLEAMVDGLVGRMKGAGEDGTGSRDGRGSIQVYAT